MRIKTILYFILFLLIFYPILGFFYVERVIFKAESILFSGEVLYNKIYLMGKALYGRENSFIENYNSTKALEELGWLTDMSG